MTLHGISFIFKIGLMVPFGKRIAQSAKPSASWIFLFVAIFCSAIEDFSWIASLSRSTFYTSVDYRYILFIIRCTWATNILMYQSLALFLESFTENKHKISLHQKLSLVISSWFFSIPLFLAFFKFNEFQIAQRPALEFDTYFIETIYVLCILMPLTLLYVWRKTKHLTSMKILKRQLDTVMKLHIIPHLLVNIYQALPNAIYTANSSLSLLALGVSNILLTAGLFYSLKQIIGLRFLDVHSHVHSPGNFNFTHDFKEILDSLGSAATISEVKLLTQRFFKQAFNIPNASTDLVVRSSEQNFYVGYKNITYQSSEASVVEFFLQNAHPEVSKNALNYLKNSKILIYDEVEYDNFYENDETRKIILAFMNQINADIFLPIYEHNNIVGYITVERHARDTKLYSDIERDEMIVFASYLSKIINLLQNRNLNELLKQRKDIIEELYLKHQEVNQYKESIRSFLHSTEQDIGIVFYKNKKFIFANKEARTIIGIDPNTQEGHPISKALKQSAVQSFIYKTNQTQLTKDSSGKQIILSAVPYLDDNTVIIMVHYPKMYDVIKSQIDAIRDPSDWDYLLYLETTQSGKLINKLIPGNGSIFLNFKIDLLKLALTKKALLLDLPEDDIISLVELLHHTSLRETLYVLDIQRQISHSETAIKLFGINPLYSSNADIPLLEKLNKTGTIFIKNIHLLDIESQNNLGQFIRYGFYTVFKSDKRVQGDVRIMCSSNADLAALVQEGRFSQILFNELRKATLSMPPLLSLPEVEMNKLVEGFTEQALTSPELNPLLGLSEKDKDSLITQRPVSLHELKNCVQSLIVKKSKKQDVYHETHFDQTYHVTDPKLIEASRLGKQALKDPNTLSVLWNTFKNKNKIALFLGVNRSSVHRRCKEYNIE